MSGPEARQKRFLTRLTGSLPRPDGLSSLLFAPWFRTCPAGSGQGEVHGVRNLACFVGEIAARIKQTF